MGTSIQPVVVQTDYQLFPFFWIVSAAFKTQIDLLMGKVLFTPNLDGFLDVIFDKTSDFARNFANSMVIGLISTFLVLVIAALVKYLRR